jgi:hypothetical protein
LTIVLELRLHNEVINSKPLTVKFELPAGLSPPFTENLSQEKRGCLRLARAKALNSLFCLSELLCSKSISYSISFSILPSKLSKKHAN